MSDQPGNFLGLTGEEMNHRVTTASADRPLTTQPSTAALWLAQVSVFFASIYWLTNQMTSVRADVGAVVFQWERAIPFIDWTIIPYGSIVAFFIASFFFCRSRAELNCHTARLVSVVLISVVCFVLWPQRFVFERPVVDGALGVLFQLLTAVDLPYNRTPSLHISVLVILWALFARCTHGWMRHAVYAWFALIGVSVLTTYQHHVIDVPAGALAGWLCVWLFPESGQPRLQTLLR
jgi:membrane-associated phospholipid phosphatase